ncbi:MAG: MoaD/ThiS family protein [Peptococcaceae bacterium]|nr:MoaD/ThiS family protein [Peptococcaceae bacterium]
MGFIELRVFSSLQAVMRERGFGFPVTLDVGDGITVEQLLLNLQIEARQVEAVMLNGKVQNSEALVVPGDRVALIPPGTPGPYRVMLGIKGKLQE